MSKAIEILTIAEIDEVIRELQKIDSKLLNGHIILAYRDVNRLIASFQSRKNDIIKAAQVEQNQQIPSEKIKP